MFKTGLSQTAKRNVFRGCSVTLFWALREQEWLESLDIPPGGWHHSNGPALERIANMGERRQQMSKSLPDKPRTLFHAASPFPLPALNCSSAV